MTSSTAYTYNHHKYCIFNGHFFIVYRCIFVTCQITKHQIYDKTSDRKIIRVFHDCAANYESFPNKSFACRN